MSNKYICPYCEVMFVLSRDTYTILETSFDTTNTIGQNYKSPITEESELRLSYYHCPSCKKYSLEVIGKGSKLSEIDLRVLPFGKAKELPDYIPKGIKEDYKEACLIKNLSPKASATLSRRCLQGMIRDYWEIKDGTLYKEINQLEDKVPAVQWKVIHAVRQIGNIGAHMEKNIDKIVDIEPMEAEKLIELIEFLINQWYVNRYETNLLYSDITNINDEKQKQKK